MYRATTPTHTFTLPINTNTLAEILVSYKQGSVKLDKHYQDGVLPSGMTLDGNKVVVKLTQEETNLFKPNAQADVQVRVLTLKSPAFIVRGSTSYFVNTYMNAVSDVRYQYVIDVYRAPKNNLNLDGWGLTQQWLKMNDDILNNNGKLT